jgi:3-methylfumaryl-CoA hydratase
LGIGVELDVLRDWIGREERKTDLLRSAPAAALAATLDRREPEPPPGSDLPPLWHWLYFNPMAPASELGPDGHPRRGGFLPPVPLPRRMWAGGRLQFHHALQIDDEVQRLSRITNVSVKQGRTGSLVFVTVRHEITNARGLAVTEEQDLVYRDEAPAATRSPPAQPAPAGEQFSRVVLPDPVLLFRYSALTFNGHRIHYDRPYATQVEGYPGLVVHGPLLATLLLDQLRRELPAATVRSFSFKAVRPVFDLHPFSVCGRRDGRMNLWVRDHEGALAMQAQAELND